MEKMYIADVICGHVGKNWGVIKTICIKAETRKVAAQIARKNPRVKHHHPNAVINVWEVNTEEFHAQLNVNSKDPYFSCTNRQQQNALCGELNRITMDSFSHNHYKKRGSAPVSKIAYERHYRVCQ
jgi:hypothetical protein